MPCMHNVYCMSHLACSVTKAVGISGNRCKDGVAQYLSAAVFSWLLITHALPPQLSLQRCFASEQHQKSFKNSIVMTSFL